MSNEEELDEQELEEQQQEEIDKQYFEEWLEQCPVIWYRIESELDYVAYRFMVKSKERQWIWNPNK